MLSARTITLYLLLPGIHIKYNNVQIHTHGTPRELEPHYLLDTNIAITEAFSRYSGKCRGSHTCH